MKILEKKDKCVESYEQEMLDNGFSKPYVASMIYEMKKAKKSEKKT